MDDCNGLHDLREKVGRRSNLESVRIRRISRAGATVSTIRRDL
jgi:hypothetical protein